MNMFRAMSGNAKTVSTFYQRMVRNHLTKVQALQTGGLMLIGDVLAQNVVEKTPLSELNFSRTLKFGSLGILFVGPVIATWYKFLATNVTRGSQTLVTIKKVSFDQLLFAPVFLPVFIIVLNLVNCKSWDYIHEELRLKYTDILIANYKIWPLTQLINFGLMPLQYQVLVAQTVAIFWNAYLSYKTQAKSE